MTLKLKLAKEPPTPPRDRILAAAGDLFSKHGIRGVGVEAIAAAAGSTKMALYRHFGSKDELVAQWLREKTEESYAMWDQIAADHPGDARKQLLAWVRAIARKIAGIDERGCPFANTMAEITDKDHPARHVIEAHKLRQRNRFIELSHQAGIPKPKFAADELFFLLEGALASAQSIGPKAVSQRLLLMGETLIARNGTRKRSRIN